MRGIVEVYKRTLDFDGRSSVREFVFYSIFMLVVLSALVYQVLDSTVDFPEEVVELFILFNFLPNLALTVRRLHDMNKSGWWVLISLIHLTGPLVLCVMLLFPRSEGENRYGAAPSSLNKENDSWR